MTDDAVIEWIQSKYESLFEDLNERARRRWAAVEALSLGRGGIAAVAKATGISDRTIRNGIRELHEGNAPPAGRQRRVGAGRKTAIQINPGLLDALEGLVEPSTRGDPQSPLKWTCKSTRELSKELKKRGYTVSHSTVARLLKDSGYSLQSNRKTIEGKQHPDRNAQFEYISRRVKSQRRADQPALSVDAKKKENIGKYKNSGRTWRRKGQPVTVQTHDFPKKDDTGKTIKAVPYGVYDIGRNEAWVNVGITHDTAQFAVASIRTWWRRLGGCDPLSAVVLRRNRMISCSQRPAVHETDISKMAFLAHALELKNYNKHGRNATCTMLLESFAAGQSSRNSPELSC